MPGGKFKVDEIGRIAKDVSKTATYPINNSDELANALGGERATVNYEGKGHKVADVRQQLPPEIFPIASEEDFIAKMASLRARSGDEAEGMQRGKQLDKLPPNAGTPRKIPESEMLPKGKAGYKGWK